MEAKIDEAHMGMKALQDMGYSASDIITIMFRVVKNHGGYVLKLSAALGCARAMHACSGPSGAGGQPPCALRCRYNRLSHPYARTLMSQDE